MACAMTSVQSRRVSERCRGGVALGFLPYVLLAFELLLTARAQSWEAFNNQPNISVSNPKWMASLPDSLPLSQLSIPGTHNTMSLYGGEITQCQSLSLAEQLNAGIRALDVRFGQVNNAFLIYHGIIYQNATFGDVLNGIREFLIANPREAILMRLKEDTAPLASTVPLIRSFAWYAWRYPGLFWRYNGNNNPTLGEIRGKVVLLQDFGIANFSIRWSTLNIQDDYQVPTRWDLHKKWDAIKTQFSNAINGDKNTTFVNFLSGSGEGLSFPWFVASGQTSPTTRQLLPTGLATPFFQSSFPDFPRARCWWVSCSIDFEGTNLLAYDHLQANFGRIGIIFADFPGPLLINRIIAMNSLR